MRRRLPPRVPIGGRRRPLAARAAIRPGGRRRPLWRRPLPLDFRRGRPASAPASAAALKSVDGRAVVLALRLQLLLRFSQALNEEHRHLHVLHVARGTRPGDGYSDSRQWLSTLFEAGGAPAHPPRRPLPLALQARLRTPTYAVRPNPVPAARAGVVGLLASSPAPAALAGPAGRDGSAARVAAGPPATTRLHTVVELGLADSSGRPAAAAPLALVSPPPAGRRSGSLPGRVGAGPAPRAERPARLPRLARRGGETLRIRSAGSHPGQAVPDRNGGPASGPGPQSSGGGVFAAPIVLRRAAAATPAVPALGAVPARPAAGRARAATERLSRSPAVAPTLPVSSESGPGRSAAAEPSVGGADSPGRRRSVPEPADRRAAPAMPAILTVRAARSRAGIEPVRGVSGRRRAPEIALRRRAAAGPADVVSNPAVRRPAAEPNADRPRPRPAARPLSVRLVVGASPPHSPAAAAIRVDSAPDMGRRAPTAPLAFRSRLSAAVPGSRAAAGQAAPPPERRFAPPPLAFRRNDAAAPAAPARQAAAAPAAAARPPAPAIDVEALSREVMKRIEKRVRVERERRGR